MPAEVRHITFSSHEVTLAADMFLTRTGRYRQREEIAGAAVSGASEPRVDVTVGHHDGSKRVVTIEGNDVLAAILVFCQQRRVPVARSATKLISETNGAVLLTLYLDVEPKQGAMYHHVFSECYRAFLKKANAA